MIYKITAGLAGILFSLALTPLFAQKQSSIDIVRVDARYEKEAMYFYQENWLAFRKAALIKGYISGYEMLRTETDSTHHFQLFLVTEYPDSTAYRLREEHFAPIMKSISPNGPKMLNQVERKVFLEYLAGYDTRRLIADHKNN